VQKIENKRSKKLEFTLKFNIGKSQLECKSPDIKQIHRMSAIYGALPKQCKCCGSDNVYLSFKNPGGNDYYGIRCADCSAELNMHQKKEGGFYVKDDDQMQVWTPQNAQQSGNYQQPQNNIPQQNANNINNQFAEQQMDNKPLSDDIPF